MWEERYLQKTTDGREGKGRRGRKVNVRRIGKMSSTSLPHTITSYRRREDKNLNTL